MTSMPAGSPASDAEASTRVMASGAVRATRILPPRTVLLRAGRRRKTFRQPRILVGAAASADFTLPFPGIPPLALAIHLTGEGIWIESIVDPREPSIPRRLDLPQWVEVAEGFRIQISDPDARRRRPTGPVLATALGLAGLAGMAWTVDSGPPTPSSPIPTAPREAPAARRPSAVAAAPAAAARSTPPAAKSHEVLPRPGAAAAPAQTRRRAVSQHPPADATSAPDALVMDSETLAEARRWLDRGLPERAADVLRGTAPAALRDPAARPMLERLRESARALRIEARAVSSFDPERAAALRRRADRLELADPDLRPPTQGDRR